MRQMQSILACLVAVAASGLISCDSQRHLPDDGFVNVPGGRISYRVLGKGDGVPLLLIHGGPGGTSCYFADTVGDIAASRPVVIYDQLGSGNSDRMLDLSRDARLPRFVAEVAAIRDELGLDQVHLAGHSWGAAVALEYLLTGDSKGVLSVSFVGPLLSTPRWLEGINALVATLPEDARDAIETAKRSGKYGSEEFKAANQVFETRFMTRTPPDQIVLPACDSTPVNFNSELYEYMWGPAEFVSTGTLRDYDRIEQLDELKLPTLFLIGEYDEARPETMREFQSRVPGSVVRVVPGAAHGINVDQPQAFNEAIAEFLASVEQG